MGTRGQVPKRSEERRRRNAPTVKQSQVVVQEKVTIPKLPAGAHPVARAFFDSLKDSGESEFYEPSDWQLAVVTSMLLSKVLNAEEVAGSQLTALLGYMKELNVSEASRRRVGIEVQRGLAEPENKPTSIEDLRKAMS